MQDYVVNLSMRMKDFQVNLNTRMKDFLVNLNIALFKVWGLWVYSSSVCGNLCNLQHMDSLQLNKMIIQANNVSTEVEKMDSAHITSQLQWQEGKTWNSDSTD